MSRLVIAKGLPLHGKPVVAALKEMASAAEAAVAALEAYCENQKNPAP
jgi:hypothetical protein